MTTPCQPAPNGAAAGASGKQCAEAFGVRESTVCELMQGKLYSEVTGIPFTPRKAVAA